MMEVYIAVLNNNVHILMYSYYFASSLTMVGIVFKVAVPLLLRGSATRQYCKLDMFDWVGYAL